MQVKDKKTAFNPWLMTNLKMSQKLSIMTPSGWLEQDCWTDCDN